LHLLLQGICRQCCPVSVAMAGLVQQLSGWGVSSVSMPPWPGVEPAIHVGTQRTDMSGDAACQRRKHAGNSDSCHNHVDGRVKPGNDEGEMLVAESEYYMSVLLRLQNYDHHRGRAASRDTL